MVPRITKVAPPGSDWARTYPGVIRPPVTLRTSPAPSSQPSRGFRPCESTADLSEASALGLTSTMRKIGGPLIAGWPADAPAGTAGSGGGGGAGVALSKCASNSPTRE